MFFKKNFLPQLVHEPTYISAVDGPAFKTLVQFPEKYSVSNRSPLNSSRNSLGLTEFTVSEMIANVLPKIILLIFRHEYKIIMKIPAWLETPNVATNRISDTTSSALDKYVLSRMQCIKQWMDAFYTTDCKDKMVNFTVPSEKNLIQKTNLSHNQRTHSIH